MSSRKGRRIAAAQQRARESAKKRARPSGPAGTPPRTTPSDVEPPEAPASSETAEHVAEATEAAAAPPRPARPAAAALSRTSAGPTLRQRREREVMVVSAGASVTRELLRIGAVTFVIAVTLVVLKLATPLGN